MLFRFLVIALSTGANKQILSPAKSAGCDVNPLRGFPR
ncbi:hypothetical protein AEST_16270 [Alishewanella aestuarii B11]|uniref:Uncharacterized protein n=1 Tax=Alishewanella aestuarii B11 TaxID=1197174 RepID=J1QJ04_9ALTE|nr:hypothetical protein AEST_16270 [Alishewanella aestuarii B11]